MKNRFGIKLTRPIVGKRFGTFQSIMKGSGIEKTDFRKYSIGDSASHINRKLSAKYQELYTTIFQQEKSLSLDIFLDINYNRRGGTYPNVEQVRAYAEDIVSYCQHQHIGITFFSPQQKFWGSNLLAKKSINNKEEILTTLHSILAGTKKTKRRYESLLSEYLQTAVKGKSRRAIVIFSDFLSLDDADKKLLHYLKKQHILFLFQLPIDQHEGQNYHQFFMKKNTAPSSAGKLNKQSGEIEMLQID